MQSFEEYYHVINEEYTYYYEQVVTDQQLTNISKQIKLIEDGVRFIEDILDVRYTIGERAGIDLYEFEDGPSPAQLQKEIPDLYNRLQQYNIRDLFDDIIRVYDNHVSQEVAHLALELQDRLLDVSQLYNLFVLFHEAEYKLNLANQYNIDPKIYNNCNKLIRRLYPILKQFLIVGIDSRFGSDLSAWLDGVGEEFHGFNQLDQIFNQLDQMGNDAESAVDMLKNAKTIQEKVIAITMSLNLTHVSGKLFGETWVCGFTKQQLDNLSNLPTNKWRQEFKKEAGLSIL